MPDNMLGAVIMFLELVVVADRQASTPITIHCDG